MEFAAQDIHRCDGPDALFEAAARRWAALAADAVRQRGAFHVALSGGSTPKGLFRRLIEDDLRGTVEWPRVHIYFGDERCVPPDHPDSNYRMARENLLQHVSIPDGLIHRMAGEDPDRDGAAAAYADLLVRELPPGGGPAPALDLVMLGLGPDGHVASLFPETAALQERGRWVTPVYVGKLQAWRLSVTFPVIEAARSVMLLVAGESKAAVVGDVLGGRTHSPAYPVELMRPRGRVEWYLDRAAAAGL